MPEKRERRTRGKGRPILPKYLQGENPKPLTEVFGQKLFEQSSEDKDGNIVHETTLRHFRSEHWQVDLPCYCGEGDE